MGYIDNIRGGNTSNNRGAHENANGHPDRPAIAQPDRSPIACLCACVPVCDRWSQHFQGGYPVFVFSTRIQLPHKAKREDQQTMEEGGITELQMLEADVEVMKSVLEGVKGAEPKSKACTGIVSSVQKLEDQDGFVVPSTERERNPYHSTASGAGGGGGCCVVS